MKKGNPIDKAIWFAIWLAMFVLIVALFASDPVSPEGFKTMGSLEWAVSWGILVAMVCFIIAQERESDMTKYYVGDAVIDAEHGFGAVTAIITRDNGKTEHEITFQACDGEKFRAFREGTNFTRIDYDLDACLIFNPQDTFDRHQIQSVLAVWEGQNDGDGWAWVLRLKNGAYAFLGGWCDYTGWDCQSGAYSGIYDSPVLCVNDMLNEDMFFYSNAEVRKSLLKQISRGKNKTWHEKKADQMGNPKRIKMKGSSDDNR